MTISCHTSSCHGVGFFVLLLLLCAAQILTRYRFVRLLGRSGGRFYNRSVHDIKVDCLFVEGLFFLSATCKSMIVSRQLAGWFMNVSLLSSV